MNKVIANCGVCGTKVAVLNSDDDPVCANCLEWYLDIETRYRIQLLTQELFTCCKRVKYVTSHLKNVKKHLFSSKQYGIINQLANLDLVTDKSLEYIRIFQGGT